MISKFRLTNIIILDLPSGPVFAPSSLIPARFANLFGIFGHSGSVIVQYLQFLLFPPHFMFLCSFFFVLPFWVWYFSSFVLQSYFSYSHSWLCNLQSCFSWFCRLPACLCTSSVTSCFILFGVLSLVFVFSFTPLLLFSQLVKLPSQVSPVCPHHLVYLFLQLYSVFVVFFLITFVCVSFLYSFWIPHSWGTFSLEFSIKAAF